jgi:hypothetical protein
VKSSNLVIRVGLGQEQASKDFESLLILLFMKTFPFPGTEPGGREIKVEIALCKHEPYHESEGGGVTWDKSEGGNNGTQKRRIGSGASRGGHEVLLDNPFDWVKRIPIGITVRYPSLLLTSAVRCVESALWLVKRGEYQAKPPAEPLLFRFYYYCSFEGIHTTGWSSPVFPTIAPPCSDII